MGGELLLLAAALAGCAFCAVGWVEARAHYRRMARANARLCDTVMEKNSEIIALKRKLSAGGRATAAKRRAELAQRQADKLAQLRQEIAHV